MLNPCIKTSLGNFIILIFIRVIDCVNVIISTYTSEEMGEL